MKTWVMLLQPRNAKDFQQTWGARREAWNRFILTVFRKNPYCKHIYLRLLSSRTLRQNISAMQAIQIAVLCYSSHGRMMHLLCVSHWRHSVKWSHFLPHGEQGRVTEIQQASKPAKNDAIFCPLCHPSKLGHRAILMQFHLISVKQIL